MDDPLMNAQDPLADPDAFDYFASDTGEFAPGDPPQRIGPRQGGRRSSGASSCGCTKRKDAAMALGAVVVGGVGIGLAVRFLRRR